jgi:hypothetical protein
MRVLVACEFSGIVREAFHRLGHDAWSCDLLPTEIDGPHIQDDVLAHLDDGWDLMIAHPPCTYLAVSGAAWFKYRVKEQVEALEFVRNLLNAKIPKIALENPVSIISTKIRKPDQIIQPWMFGHNETKKTCIWLKGLKPLIPTNDVYNEMLKLPERIKHKNHWESPGPDRWKRRSRTYLGIADAMGWQWGGLVS